MVHCGDEELEDEMLPVFNIADMPSLLIFKYASHVGSIIGYKYFMGGMTSAIISEIEASVFNYKNYANIIPDIAFEEGLDKNFDSSFSIEGSRYVK